MFEERIEKRFRYYLRSYHDCLNSIADLLTSRFYKGGADTREECLLEGLLFLQVDTDIVSTIQRASGDQNRVMKNLLNAWYHECALRHPFDENKSEDRMKFASWKIIQFYYSIFTGLSAINRTFYKKRWNHDTAINLFVDNILMSPVLNPSFFVPPFSFVLSVDRTQLDYDKTVSWDYGRTFHCPRVEKKLRERYEKTQQSSSVFHFFKDFREWATYQDSYVFINLYGVGPKSELERYLNDISFCFSYLVERYLIAFFGLDEIRAIYDDFTMRMNRHLQLTPQHLVSRFDCYETYL